MLDHEGNIAKLPTMFLEAESFNRTGPLQKVVEPWVSRDTRVISFASLMSLDMFINALQVFKTNRRKFLTDVQAKWIEGALERAHIVGRVTLEQMFPENRKFYRGPWFVRRANELAEEEAKGERPPPNAASRQALSDLKHRRNLQTARNFAEIREE